MSALVILGALSLLAQVVVLRELAVACYGVELAAVVALGAWMAGSAVGATVDRRRTAPGMGAIAALAAVLGGGTLVVAALVRTSRVMLGGIPGAYLPVDRQLATLALATVPLAGVAGLGFQWAARRAVGHGRTLAWAYAVESVGALAGGAAATIALRAGMQTLSLAAWTAWAGIVAGGTLACATPRDAGRRRVALACFALAGGYAAVVVVPALDLGLSRWTHPALVAARDTPYGRIIVERRGGEVAVFENDTLAFTTGDVDAEVLASLVLLQHPRPLRVTVLGGALEGVPGEVLEHGPRVVTLAELDRQALEVAIRFAPDQARALRDPRLHLAIGDPRRLLRQVAEQDVILLAVDDPVSGASNRFYTREFFALCRARLARHGIVGLRLRVSENAWTAAQRARVGSIYRALSAVFPHVLVLPTPSVLVMAGSRTPPPPVETVLARLASRPLQPRLVSGEFVRYVYENDRKAEALRAIGASHAAANADASPVAFRAAMIVWLGTFWPALSTWELEAWSTPPVVSGCAAVVLLAVALLARGYPKARGSLLVFLAALAGMVLEAVVLLAYQVTSGVLFVDLGILLTMVMAGLAAGAAVVDRAARLWSRAGGAALVGALGGVSAGMAAWTAAGLSSGLLPSAVTLAVAGGLVGAVFAWASVRRREPQAPLIGPLYAADLLGGCFGAIAGGLLLIPFAGLAGAAWVAAALAWLALVLV